MNQIITDNVRLKFDKCYEGGGGNWGFDYSQEHQDSLIVGIAVELRSKAIVDVCSMNT